VPTGGTIRAGQLLVLGLGPREDLTLEKVRRAAGTAARNVGNAASVALALPAGDADHVRAVAEGFLMGQYAYTGRKGGGKKGGEKDQGKVAEVALLSDVARQQAAQDALAAAQVVAGVVNRARDWVNTPPNDFYPERFAEAVRTLDAEQGRRSPVRVEVLGVPELTELGCGGVLGVGQGSTHEPRMVRLTYAPQDAVATLALVGKGITYDSGGLSIKSGASMATMKYDMGGAAAVLAATYAIAALGIPVAVTTYAPMAENMPGGNAMRPGDVLTMYDGQTVEVTNTDAEGRLVLADALGMAIEQQPDAVVDVATLTGACVASLGEKVAGLFGDDATTSLVREAAERSGEQFWRLPIPEQIAHGVRTESKVADVLQVNFVRWGSASWAAAFLAEFVGETPWAHLDIAGPAWNSGGPSGHVPAGATGFGIPTLVEVAETMARTAQAAGEQQAG
jgi:leucyl aminopeptidase